MFQFDFTWEKRSTVIVLFMHLVPSISFSTVEWILCQKKKRKVYPNEYFLPLQAGNISGLFPSFWFYQRSLGFFFLVRSLTNHLLGWNGREERKKVGDGCMSSSLRPQNCILALMKSGGFIIESVILIFFFLLNNIKD